MASHYNEILRAVRSAVETVDPWGKLVGENRAADAYAAVVEFLAARLAGGDILYPALIQEAFASASEPGAGYLDEEDVREIARRIGSELGFGG